MACFLTPVSHKDTVVIIDVYEPWYTEGGRITLCSVCVVLLCDMLASAVSEDAHVKLTWLVAAV